LSEASNTVEVLCILTLFLWNSRSLKICHDDGTPIDFIVYLPSSVINGGQKDGKKRSRSNSKQSEPKKSEKKKKKGKASGSKTRSSSRKGHKKEKKDKRDGNYDKSSNHDAINRSKKAMNMISLLLSKLLELPELANYHIFNISLEYYTLEIDLRKPFSPKDGYKDSSLMRPELFNHIEKQQRALKFLDLINSPHHTESMSTLEKFCWNVILISIPESPLMALVLSEFNDPQIQLSSSNFGSSRLLPLTSDSKGYEAASMISNVIVKGTFNKFFLGAIKTFEELHKIIESYNILDLPIVIDNLVSTGWLEVLCLEVIKLHKVRKLELEEIRVLEVIFAQMCFKTTRSLEKIYALIEQMQREDLMMSFSSFNHRDSKAFVESLCKSLNHKSQITPSLRDKEGEREYEFYQNVADSRIRTRNRFSGSHIDINLASLLLLLNHAVVKFNVRSLKFAELVFDKFYDGIFKAVDVMLDLFWVCRYPESANFEENTKADLNPKHYLQISLRCVHLALVLFREKLEFICNSRSSLGEFLNVDLITLCGLIYSTELEVDSGPELIQLKADIDNNIERIVHAAGKFDLDSKSPADRVLNKLIEVSITSPSTAKNLKLLVIYLSSCSKTQSNQAFIDTLLKKPASRSQSLRNYCSERTLLYIFDYMADSLDRSSLFRLMTHVVHIPDQNAQYQLKRLFEQLLKQDWKVHEGIYKLMEEVARNEITGEKSSPVKALQGFAKNNYFGILLILARNPIWKAISMEGDLGDLLLADLENSLKEGWYLDLDINLQSEHLCSFLKLASILVNREFGMTSFLSDTKDSKEGSKLEYLFEDLPKESLIQDMVRKLDAIIQPIIGYLNQNKNFLDQEHFSKILMNWTNFLKAMSQSTICQIMLLYTLYTKQVKTSANPLTTFENLLQVLLSIENPILDEALSNTLLTVCNLMSSPSTGKPLKSKKRLTAVEKMLGGELSVLLPKIAFHVDNKTDQNQWTVLSKLLCDKLSNDLLNCSTQFDKDENESYSNSRDFKERLRKFLRLNEEREKEILKKYPKKRVGAFEFNYAFQSFIFQFNEKTTEVLLPEDSMSRVWHKTFLEENSHFVGMSLHDTFSGNLKEKDEQIEFEFNRKAEDLNGKGSEPETYAKMDFSVFKEIIFQNTHRLIESKTYTPMPETSRPGGLGGPPGLAFGGGVPSLSRVSSTRAASTHVDEFKGVPLVGPPVFPDKPQQMQSTPRPETPQQSRTPSVYQPTMPLPTPTMAFEAHGPSIAPFGQQTQFAPAPVIDYSPFHNLAPAPHTAPLVKNDAQALLALVKNKLLQRKPPTG
jgi:hypothetical protein